MSLTAQEIGKVTHELAEALQGALVRKVFSPALPDRILLELRTAGQNHYLQFVLAPATTRLGRIDEKPNTAQKPHPFVMLLRREAIGRKLISIEQINRDRAVKVSLGRSGSPVASIVAELTSRHGNLFWLDDQNIILGSFHPNRSHKRRLVPGEEYTPPLFHPPPQEQDKSRFPQTGESIERQVENHYRNIENRTAEEGHRAAARRLASKARRHLIRLTDKLEKDLDRARESARLQECGHLLQANLHQLKKGDNSIKIIDFEGNSQIVPLNPALDPVANMQKYFDKAKRLRRATPIIGDRRELISQRLKGVEQLLVELEDCQTARALEIQQELGKLFPQFAPERGGPHTPSAPRLPYREFAIAQGRTARVGRSAKENDDLTLRHAKPLDLWLHVRNRKGCHVVVPLGKGEEPQAELLIDAAHLAAHFSDARGEQDVEVTYTRRRYVQKPRGAAPGSVRILREKTVSLRVEKDRLKRLLE